MLSTGEFARLCKTTKETLFHYDRIGLLKPRRRTPEGFRLYGAEQYFAFNAISLFKETGSSLAEIKALLGGLVEVDAVRLLEEKRCALAAERERLRLREKMLKGIIAGLRSTQGVPEDVLRFEERPAARFTLHAVAGGDSSIEDAVERFAAFGDALAKKGIVPLPPYGSIVQKAAALERRYLDAAYFTGLDGGRRATEAETLALPAGRWALWDCREALEETPRGFLAFLDAIEREGLKLASDVYVFYLLTYTFNTPGGRFRLRYAALTEKL